ncbi:MAG: peptidoglycan DD-metalloendopeptidase family protein, partial [Actinomycetes bacterium]
MASWNTLAYNSTGRVVAGIRAIGGAADVVGLQEFNPESRRRSVARQLSGTWQFSKGNNSVQIAWKPSRLELLAQGSVHVAGLTRLEPGVSGTAIGPKSLQWVQLRDRAGGGTFFVANHHIVPSIDHRGRPVRSRPKRLALYDKQMSAMERLVGKLRAAAPTAPIITVGDLNVNDQADARNRDPFFPHARMDRLGLVSNWSVLGYPGHGTSGSRYIDSVWSTSATAAPTVQRILPKYGSDHSALAVTLTNSRRTGPAVAAASGRAAPPGSAQGSISAARGTGQADPLPSELDAAGTMLRGEQVANAAAIIAEGKAAGVPAQGWVVALAAALQESGIRALTGGDRDSEGIFQQRPSTGWGTSAQIRDPRLSAQAFYGVATHTRNAGLTDVRGWQSMTIAQAAQAVQRSAFPSAYGKWEAAARAIVQRLGGTAAGGVAAGDLSTMCGDGDVMAAGGGRLGSCPRTGLPAEHGLTPDALLVLRCGREAFPKITTFYGVASRETASDHPSGRGVDLMVPDYQTAGGKAYGWQVARWMKANHVALGVHYVIFDAKIWNVDRDAEGWRPYGSVTGSINASSMHYDHVHVSVFGDQGTGLKPASQLGRSTSGWTMLLPKGSYRVGGGLGSYRGHTGQDFPVPTGTDVAAVDDATVVRSVGLKRGSEYVSYGNLIVLRLNSDPDTEIYYAHLSQRLVDAGDQVREGQAIGKSGSTGRSTGPHVHFEVRLGGNPV